MSSEGDDLPGVVALDAFDVGQNAVAVPPGQLDVEQNERGGRLLGER